MRILLTGASGRIGRALHARLARQHEVRGLDRVPSPTAEVVGDVGDAGLVRRLLTGADAVLHCAALHAPHVGVRPDAEFERVNVEATRTLAEAAARAGVKHLVYTSTTALYGAAGRGLWIDETTQPQPQTIYHRSKLAAEQLLQAAAERGDFRLTVLRMGRCFPEPAPQMAVYRLHRGVDARDVAEAHALALERGVEGLFIVSGATPFRPDDLPLLQHDAPAVIAQRAPALAAAFRQRGWPLPRSIDRVYASAAAQRALGWWPRHGFESVLAQLDAGTADVLAAPVENDRCRFEPCCC